MLEASRETDEHVGRDVAEGRRRPQVTQRDIYLHRRADRPNAYEQQKTNGFLALPTPHFWPLDIPLDWAADPFQNRNWCYQLHAWRMVDPILERYFATEAAHLLREALVFALDWHRFHFVERKHAFFSWNDMATGIRAMRIAFFLDRARSRDLDITEDELGALHELADEHAMRLKQPGFISLHNHGICQVFGLNLLYKVEPGREANQGARELAAEMLEKLVHLQFTDEGIHSEHSPHYHLFAVALFEGLGIKRHFEPGPGIELVAKARSNCGWLVFPNGEFPRIGDSSGQGVPIAEAPVTTLLDGREFWVGDFTRSGYAIVRDARADAKSMLFLTGMARSATHKHADDLTFELFEWGRFIFVDTGKCGYNIDEKRRYAWSSVAHNTISIAEKAISQLCVENIGSALSPIACDGKNFRVAGQIARPELFKQRREVVYDPGRFLVISDEVTAGRPWTYLSNLHLAPDLHPEISDDGFFVAVGKGRHVSARIVSPDVTIRSARGQTKPMLGWVTCGYGELEPATTVSAECPGQDRTITWAIWFDEEWRDEALALARRLDRRPQAVDSELAD